MDSYSSSSTNCTVIQLPIYSLSQWAIDMVHDGRKSELANLLVALPTIKMLSDLGLGQNIINITEIEEKALMEAAQIKGNFNEQSKRKDQLAEFKKSVGQQIKAFTELLVQNADYKFEKQYEMIKGLNTYSRQSGLKFFAFLEESNATQEQLEAFQYYLSFQWRTENDFIRCEQFSLQSLGRSLEVQGQVSRRSKSVKKEDERRKQKSKNRESIFKKGRKQDRLKIDRSDAKLQKKR